jgi:hypothetical protein
VVLVEDAEAREEPDRPDGRVAAHFHLVVRHPEPQGDVRCRSLGRRQHEGALVTGVASHVLHLLIGHGVGAEHDRCRIAAARPVREHDDRADVGVHGLETSAVPP